MKPWMLSLVLQPLAAFALFLVAALIARPLLRRLPDGRLKAILGYRMNGRGAVFEIARVLITLGVLLAIILGLMNYYDIR